MALVELTRVPFVRPGAAERVFVTSVSYRSIETRGASIRAKMQEPPQAPSLWAKVFSCLVVSEASTGGCRRIPPSGIHGGYCCPRDPEGFLVIGSVWRRRVGAAWEYKTRTTSVLAKIYERERPDSLDQWHNWNLLGWPKRSVEGRFLLGRVWRRRLTANRIPGAIRRDGSHSRRLVMTGRTCGNGILL